MEINRQEHGAKGVFFIEAGGGRLAEMTYVKDGPEKIIIDHTEVDETIQGKGIGKELVKAGVDFARKNNLKIVPRCPFVKAEFEKHVEYRDVLAG